MKNWWLCVLFAGIVLASGCIQVHPSKTANSGAEFTNKGLPNLKSINDGATRDIGERVLLFNKVDGNDSMLKKQKNTVVINFTVTDDRGSLAFKPSAITLVQWTIHASIAGDSRLEPPNERDKSDQAQAYRIMRAYLADAMIYENEMNGPILQDLYLIVGEDVYQVSLGSKWVGGPVIDPSDPPHNLTVDPSVPAGKLRILSEGILSEGADVIWSGNVREGPIYTFKESGNYSIELVSDNRTYITQVNVTIFELGDCNDSAHHLRFNNSDGLSTSVRGSLIGCPDPAD